MACFYQLFIFLSILLGCQDSGGNSEEGATALINTLTTEEISGKISEAQNFFNDILDLRTNFFDPPMIPGEENGFQGFALQFNFPTALDCNNAFLLIDSFFAEMRTETSRQLEDLRSTATFNLIETNEPVNVQRLEPNINNTAISAVLTIPDSGDENKLFTTSALGNQTGQGSDNLIKLSMILEEDSTSSKAKYARETLINFAERSIKFSKDIQFNRNQNDSAKANLIRFEETINYLGGIYPLFKIHYKIDVASQNQFQMLDLDLRVRRVSSNDSLEIYGYARLLNDDSESLERSEERKGLLVQVERLQGQCIVRSQNAFEGLPADFESMGFDML